MDQDAPKQKHDQRDEQQDRRHQIHLLDAQEDRDDGDKQAADAEREFLQKPIAGGHKGARVFVAGRPETTVSGPGGSEPAAGRRGYMVAGTGIWLKISAIIDSAVTPLERASGRRMIRCASTGFRQPLHVVREHIGASLQAGVRLRGVQQEQRSARAGAELRHRMLAGGGDNVDDIIAHRGIDVDVGRFGLQRQQLLARDDRLQAIHRTALRRSRQDANLFVVFGIADGEAHQKPVHLRFGQWVSAVRFDVILGGDDKERTRQFVGDAVARHLPLLHALQKGRLRLGRGAVDLVGEHDIREHGAFPELELAVLLIEDSRCP